MLGCQDFCGHYEWTFHYVRRRWGQDAVRRFWAEAIGGESQQHYTQSAVRSGLPGLCETCVQTGVDEGCDWTLTCDEAKNILRCDMRECPSKGFLIKNDRNADEDYCDHCMGWEIPLLARSDIEIVAHEHNHCGQCWEAIRVKGLPSEPIEIEADIRRDPRWNHGYVHRWENGQRQPLMPSVSASPDPCDVLAAWFAPHNSLTILGNGSQETHLKLSANQDAAVLTTDGAYANRRWCPVDPAAVLIGNNAANLTGLAARFLAASPDRRPLLLYPFLPRVPMLDFVSLGLPRPMPILPLLIRCGLYVHQSGGPNPDPMELLSLLAVALQKRIIPADVDLQVLPASERP